MRRPVTELTLEHEGTPLDTVDFAVVDVETTGTGARFGERVIEVAAFGVRAHRVTPLFHSLVHPTQPIPWAVQRLTGITDAMVREAPAFGDIAGDLAGQLAGRVFVAHNVAFDWGFLEAEYGRLSRALAGIVPAQLCTVRLARRVLRHLPRRNLDAVCAHYGVANAARHRAHGDAEATAHVLVKLLRDADRAGLWSLEQVLRHARRRRTGRRSALPTSTDGASGA